MKRLGMALAIFFASLVAGMVGANMYVQLLFESTISAINRDYEMMMPFLDRSLEAEQRLYWFSSILETAVDGHTTDVAERLCGLIATNADFVVPARSTSEAAARNASESLRSAAEILTRAEQAGLCRPGYAVRVSQGS